MQYNYKTFTTVVLSLLKKTVKGCSQSRSVAVGIVQARSRQSKLVRLPTSFSMPIIHRYELFKPIAVAIFTRD